MVGIPAKDWEFVSVVVRGVTVCLEPTNVSERMTVTILLVHRDFSLSEEGTAEAVRSSSALTRRGEHDKATGSGSRPTQEPKQTYTSSWSDLTCDTLCPFLRKCLSISCRTSRATGHVPSCPLSAASSPGWMYSSRPTSCRFQMVCVGHLLILTFLQKFAGTCRVKIFNPLFLQSKILIPTIQKP